MKRYTIEVTREIWVSLRAYLIGYGIQYEPAECFNLIHITIWCNERQAENINNFLERVTIQALNEKQNRENHFVNIDAETVRNQLKGEEV